MKKSELKKDGVMENEEAGKCTRVTVKFYDRDPRDAVIINGLKTNKLRGQLTALIRQLLYDHFSGSIKIVTVSALAMHVEATHKCLPEEINHEGIVQSEKIAAERRAELEASACKMDDWLS